MGIVQSWSLNMSVIYALSLQKAPLEKRAQEQYSAHDNQRHSNNRSNDGYRRRDASDDKRDSNNRRRQTPY